jgi:hypothetical protein
MAVGCPRAAQLAHTHLRTGARRRSPGWPTAAPVSTGSRGTRTRERRCSLCPADCFHRNIKNDGSKSRISSRRYGNGGKEETRRPRPGGRPLRSDPHKTDSCTDPPFPPPFSPLVHSSRPHPRPPLSPCPPPPQAVPLSTVTRRSSDGVRGVRGWGRMLYYDP